MSANVAVVVTVKSSNGDSDVLHLEPGQYAVICAEPRYQVSHQEQGDGSVVVLLKTRPGAPS